MYVTVNNAEYMLKKLTPKPSKLLPAEAYKLEMKLYLEHHEKYYQHHYPNLYTTMNQTLSFTIFDSSPMNITGLSNL